MHPNPHLDWSLMHTESFIWMVILVAFGNLPTVSEDYGYDGDRVSGDTGAHLIYIYIYTIYNPKPATM